MPIAVGIGVRPYDMGAMRSAPEIDTDSEPDAGK